MKKIQRNLIGILLICLMLAGLLTTLPLDASAETVTQTSEKIYGYADWGGAKAATFALEVEAKVRITFAYSEGLSSISLVKTGSGLVTPTSVSSGSGNYGDTYKYDKMYYYDLEPGEYAINVFAGAYENTGGTVYWLQIRATYEVHTHDYSYSTKKVAPTCTARGYTKHTCSCGDYYTDNYVDKLPHTEVYAPREAPTCTKTGKDEGTKCSVCGTTISGRTEIPKLPHDTAVEIPRVEPTCTTLGKTAGAKCSVCGTISIAQESIPKLPHTEVSTPGIEPTCTTDGKTDVKFCTVCEQEVSRTVIPKLGHNFVEYFCTRCGCVDSSVVRDYGQCGDNAKWVLTKSGTMNIIGTGAMWDYKYQDTPWFSDRTYVRSIVVGDGVTRIGNYAFYSCFYATDVTISETVTSIGNYAFSKCNDLRSVSIPYGVEELGTSAFSRCELLESVTLPASIVSIGGYAFYECTKLTSVTLPEGIKTIAPYVFAECSSLEYVTLPSSLETLGEYAFFECTDLTRIAIHEGVTIIDCYTFYGCTSLEKVWLPSSLTTIKSAAFTECHKLKSITIPSNVTRIEGVAFGKCSALKQVTFEGSAPIFTSEKTFVNTTTTAYYHSSDPTWTASVRQNYGGTITWKNIDSCNHRWVGGSDMPPTCVSNGMTSGVFCYFCGTVQVKQQVIPATGHSLECAVSQEPTLTEAGVLAGTCTVCGGETTVTLPILSEEAYDYTVTAEPTYTETGLATYTWKETAYGTYTFEVVLETLPILYGDVNGDGTVNNKDRLVLTRYLAKWTDYPAEVINMAAADVNADGTVNNKDRLILTRHLAKWTGYEELPYKQ